MFYVRNENEYFFAKIFVQERDNIVCDRDAGFDWWFRARRLVNRWRYKISLVVVAHANLFLDEIQRRKCATPAWIRTSVFLTRLAYSLWYFAVVLITSVLIIPFNSHLICGFELFAVQKK